MTLGVLALVAAPTVSAAAASGGDEPDFSWEYLDSDTEALLNSLDAVGPDVAWAASVDGVVLRTVDGGATFMNVSPPDSSEVDFLDVEASSAEDALLIAVGPAGASIYRTADGGESWDVPFNSTMDFFNCMAMFNRRDGFAMGDPVDGKFQVIVTSDSGRSWDRIDPAGMPDTLEGEFGLGFAGNCAAATGKRAFFGTGFTPAARVFRSADRGVTWEVSSTGDECCIPGLDFRTNRLGLAAGENISRTTDGGVTWQLVAEDAPAEVFFGDVAWWSDRRGDERSDIPDAQRTAFTDSSYVTRDRGKTWEQFAEDDFISVDCAEDSETCWAVGDFGTIVKLVVS